MFYLPNSQSQPHKNVRNKKPRIEYQWLINDTINDIHILFNDIHISLFLFPFRPYLPTLFLPQGRPRTMFCFALLFMPGVFLTYRINLFYEDSYCLSLECLESEERW